MKNLFDVDWLRKLFVSYEMHAQKMFFGIFFKKLSKKYQIRQHIFKDDFVILDLIAPITIALGKVLLGEHELGAHVYVFYLSHFTICTCLMTKSTCKIDFGRRLDDTNSV